MHIMKLENFNSFISIRSGIVSEILNSIEDLSWDFHDEGKQFLNIYENLPLKSFPA